MEDTIAAVSTAYGEGGIGIIRISGENAGQILKKVFVPFSGTHEKFEGRKLCYGKISDPEKHEVIDEVLAVYMKAPHTYTREDVVEIDCHGSVISLRRILALVISCGARPAERGEFTKRAFLNGRLDLSQAEAVIDMIKAKTDRGFDLAVNQLEGAFSDKVHDLRRELTELLAEITVNLDYPDEDIEEMTYEKLRNSLLQIGDVIEKLIDTSNTGRIIKEGLNVVIAGRPNVGKSSLMNNLLREGRVIVTDIPGTTRDIIEETINIRGIPVRLIDTAGIRNTDDRIEKIGIEKSKAAFNKADLIIFMLDDSEGVSEEDKEIIDAVGDRKAIVLANKSDIGKAVSENEIKKMLPSCLFIETSMLSGEGMEMIETEIEALVYGGKVRQNESLIVTSARHENLLNESSKALGDALEMTDKGEALDLIEIDIRRCYDFLGEIIGETVSEDILDEVFSRFCLGK